MSALVVNGWTIYAHPLFLEQVSVLTARVRRLQAKHPLEYQNRATTKRLAAIVKLALEDIPTNPADAQYRQGKTMGSAHTHWYRAKFYQQYRLFYRFHQASKTIIYAWVNDETTKRAYGNKTDAYSVFAKMLEQGDPPTTWKALLEAAQKDGDTIQQRLCADL